MSQESQTQGEAGGMFDRLKRTAFERCIPLNVTLELTLRCNLKCQHCYNFDRELPYLPLKRREEELSDAEVLRVIDELQAEGCLYLALSGGEALVHPGLDAFVRHATALGLLVTVKTNGVLLDEARARALSAAGARDVEISVYGARAETHDLFVKAPGAFARTLDGVRAAGAAGLGVKLSFVLLQRNADEVPQMIALAEGLGVGYAIDPQLTARYDGSRGSLEHRLDRATLERLYRGPLAALAPAPVSARASVQCACARSVCGVSAFGEVYPCIGAPIPSGSLRRASFHEIWTGSPTLKRIRGLTLEDFPTCARCEERPYCRRSSGVIYTNTGDYTGPPRFGDDWTCMEAEVLHALHDERAAHGEAPGEAQAKRPGAALRRHSQDP